MSTFIEFCETLLPNRSPWTARQLQAVEAIEQAVSEGGYHHVELARGEGGTTLCWAALQWIGMNSLRQYVLFVTARQHCAEEMFRRLRILSDRPAVTKFPGGTVLQASGILSNCRGLARTIGGKRMRPDLIIADNPFCQHTPERSGKARAQMQQLRCNEPAVVIIENREDIGG